MIVKQDLSEAEWPELTGYSKIELLTDFVILEIDKQGIFLLLISDIVETNFFIWIVFICPRFAQWDYSDIWILDDQTKYHYKSQ